MNQHASDEPVLACRLYDGIFDERQQERYQKLRRKIDTAVEAVEELPDGVALRFPPDNDLVITLAEFITLERLCCEFFDFNLEVAAGTGPMRLCLTGPAGVKSLLKTEFDRRPGKPRP